MENDPMDEMFPPKRVAVAGPVLIETFDPNSFLIQEFSGEFRFRHYRLPKWWELGRRWRERRVLRRAKRMIRRRWPS